MWLQPYNRTVGAMPFDGNAAPMIPQWPLTYPKSIWS